MNRTVYHCCRAALRCLFIALLCQCGMSINAQGSDLADGQIQQVGNDVLAGLEHAREFIKDGQWSDAVETLTRIMENQSDALIQVPWTVTWKELGFGIFVPLREYCQMELASWHARAPEALAIYRRRVDALAERWYQQAVAAHSETQLQRIVDELMLSSSGDQALLQLGEMALERGDYTLARRSWESLSPTLRVPPAAARLLGCVPGCSWWMALQGRSVENLWPLLAEVLAPGASDVTWLAYPDSDIPLAAVRARLILVSLLEGSLARARLELDLLCRLHPHAEGELAGRRGTYAELAGQLVRDGQLWPSAAQIPGWTTLAGCPARNRVVREPVDIARRPVWRAALPRLEDAQELLGLTRPRVGELEDGLLSYHVTVSDGIVYILQPGTIRAIELSSGRPAWPLLPAGRAPQDADYGAIFKWSRAPREAIPRHSAHVGVPRYFATVDGQRLFARMGTTWTGGGSQTLPRSDERSFLVGIDVRTQKLLFDRILPDDAGWEFESSPVANDSYLFVSLRRRDPASAQIRVACYAIQTGRLAWQRDIVRGEALRGVLFEVANNTLALHDDTLYCNTNLGVVAALRVHDGHVRWMCRYPRAGLQEDETDADDRHWFRDQTPCLVHHDLILAAPADCNRIFAVDAALGQIVWATAAGVAADAIHLLGVGPRHLLASGDCLYWIDIRSGKLEYQFPAPRNGISGFAVPSPRGYGRGILAGDQVFWPTYESIYVFDQRSNQQVRQPIELRTMGLDGGNLVIDGDTLLIAGADQLTALNRWGRPFETAATAGQGTFRRAPAVGRD